jgi:predicted acylesterase/phospholipase RssA
MKTTVVITAFEKNDNDPEFEQLTNTPTYFSNSTVVPVLTGQTHLAVDVAMATSAAPLYFPPKTIGSLSYIDGGIVQNNPALFGVAIAKAIKKNANRTCVLSLGTGLGDVGFGDPYMVTALKQEIEDFKESPKLYAKKYNVSDEQMDGIQQLHNVGILEGGYLLMFLLGAMTTAPQEAAAMELYIQSNFQYTLDNMFSYYFQYYLDTAKDTELDSTSADVFSYYQSSAAAKYSANSTDITTFLGHLMA